MFTNRQDAGRQLAGRLTHLADRDPIVLGLPRGGVVVAAEVAAALDAPLDVLVVRKLGAPTQPELAIGAVTNGAHPRHILNEQVIKTIGVDRAYLDREIEHQLGEVRRRQTLYRSGRDAPHLRGRCLIVVDDGIATGATVRAGILALRLIPDTHIVLAVPVAPPETAGALQGEVDELVCLHTPTPFAAVGSFYEDFAQVSDEQVIALLTPQTAG